MLVVPLVAYGGRFAARAKRCLASLRSAGNLPDVETRVIVYTDRPAEFPGLETRRVDGRAQKHEATTACYRDALQFGHPIVPVAADMVCAEGMLAALEARARTKRLVVMPVLRVNEATMPLVPKDGVLAFSPRELCRAALGHIHPKQLGMFYPGLAPAAQPTTIFRRRGETIVARCFHMHPMLVSAPPGTEMPAGLDGRFVNTVPREQIHIVTDSDEALVVDASAPEYDWEPGYTRPLDLRDWAARKTNAAHRWFFGHECYIHAGDLERLEPEPWLDAFHAEVLALPARA